MNQIRKLRTSPHASNPTGKVHWVRRWGYQCSKCGHHAVVPHYSGMKNSRKCAKDLLHRHNLKEHAGLG